MCVLQRFNCSALAEDRYNLEMTKNSTFYLQIIPTNSNLEKARFKLKLIPTGATFSSMQSIRLNINTHLYRTVVSEAN